MGGSFELRASFPPLVVEPDQQGPAEGMRSLGAGHMLNKATINPSRL